MYTCIDICIYLHHLVEFPLDAERASLYGEETPEEKGKLIRDYPSTSSCLSLHINKINK